MNSHSSDSARRGAASFVEPAAPAGSTALARDPAIRRTPAETTACIFGCAGPALTASERAFFAEARPWAFILFARNIVEPDQVKRLVAELRAAVGWNAPVLIDQEGGRVARLGAPHWRVWRSVGLWCDAADAGDWTEDALLEALRLRYAIIGGELRALGIDVDCAPLLDVRRAETHEIIGARALGRSADRVADRARAVCDGLATAAVAPVVKHIPGHGRAVVDSHHELPVVEADRETLSQSDFAAFRAVSDQAMAMTGHLVFSTIDPEDCATFSARVLSEVVRGEIGFKGVLMTDDLSMRALSGDFADRARRALAAGCDLVLHCNGDPHEMARVMAGAAALDGAALARADAALARFGGSLAPEFSTEMAAAEERLAALLGPHPELRAGDADTGARAEEGAM